MRPRRLRSVSCLAILIAITAGGSVRADEETWLEVRTTHFVVRGDAGRDDLVKRAVGLEKQYQALSQIFRELLGAFTAPAEVVQVIYFRSCDRVEHLNPHHPG